MGNALTQQEIIDKVGAISETLNNKMDKDMSNTGKPYLKTAYVNGASGYNIWSNGYCEQWGYTTSESVSLTKTYRDTNYNILMAQRQGSAYAAQPTAPTVNSFTYYQYQNTRDAYWKTSGYLAEGQY